MKASREGRFGGRWGRAAGWLLVLVVVASCAADPDDGALCLDDAPVAANACSRAVVPTRMGFAWEALNHRISTMDTRLDYGCGATEGRTTIIGGDFTTGEVMDDDALLRWRQLELDATDLGDCGPRFGRVSLETVVTAPTYTERMRRTVSRSGLGLRSRGTVHGVIQGFGFDTRGGRLEGFPEDYNPDHGYTTRGYGMEVHVRDLGGDELEVIVDVRFEPGLSHDRENHNEAMPFAAIATRVDVLLVDSVRTPVHTGGVSYVTEHPAPPFGRDVPVPPPPEEARRVVLQGTPGAPEGFWGWRKFDFLLEPPEACSRRSDCARGNVCTEEGVCSRDAGVPGYYIREISVDLDLLDFDAQSGIATFDVLGYASNATRVIEFYALQSTFRGEFTWWQAPVAARAEDHALAFPAGSASWPAPPAPDPPESPEDEE